MTDLLGRLAAVALETVATLGYVGLAALTALEVVFPPLPSELIVPFAGFLVGQGRMGFAEALVAATAGSVVGAYVVYGLARGVGERRVRGWVGRHGRWLLMDEEDVESADRWFDRHGAAALILGRLVPGVRSVVAIPAGLRRMHPLRFGVYTAIGAGGWNAALLGAGALLGHRWEALSGWIDVLSWIAVGAAVVLAGAWVVRRRRRRPRRSDESATTR